MKLIIDIPEETYQDVVKNGFIYDEDGEVISHAIKNGTSLDKIRAEIKELRFGQSFRKFVVDEVLQIIDKYRNEVNE